jgi:hypothetical protein
VRNLQALLQLALQLAGPVGQHQALPRLFVHGVLEQHAAEEQRRLAGTRVFEEAQAALIRPCARSSRVTSIRPAFLLAAARDRWRSMWKKARLFFKHL